MPRLKPETPQLATESQVSSEYAVKTLRMQWFGFLTCMIAIFCCGALMAMKGTLPVSKAVQPILYYVMLAAFVVGPMIGFFIRMQIYKRGYVVDRVTPRAYITANQTIYGIFIGISVLAAVAVGAVGMGLFSQFVLVFIFTMVLMALNFPNGKPMQPAPPALLNS